MMPYRVGDHEQPEEQKVRVLNPATRARRQRADRMGHEAVVRPQQTMDEDDDRDDDRACDACCGRGGDYQAPLEVGGQSLLPHQG
jgi:hypothetical protein